MWWPFKKTPASTAPTITTQPRPQTQQRKPSTLEPPPVIGGSEKLTPRQSTIHPALRTITTNPPQTPPKPFEDEKTLTALPATPGSVQRQLSGHLAPPRSQSGNGLGRISFDTAGQEALAARRGVEGSPHLRPVPESDLNRSASTRSRVSLDLLRRRSTKSTKKGTPTKREAQLREVSGSTKRSADLSRSNTTGSKRQRPGGISAHKQGQSSIESIQALPPVKTQAMGWGEHSHLALTPVGVLSPRPKLHYTVSNSQHYASSLPASSRLDLAKGKMPASREAASQTIDELADEMDAGALRELMDRDQKRRTRKRQEQEERARKRLERYAARGEDVETARHRRELAELDAAAADVAKLQRGEPLRGRQPSRKLHDSVVSTETRGDTIYDPFADPEDVMAAVRSGRSIFPEVPARASDSISPPARTRRFDPHAASPPLSPGHQMKARSHLTLVTNAQDEVPAMQEVLRPTSSESAVRRGPLSSLFRRSMRSGSAAPPSEGSFSNTSRESMAKRPLPSHLQDRALSPMSPILAASGTLRSVSKFREDLPEMPLSPPDSRLASPAIMEESDITEAEPLESALRPSLSVKHSVESPTIPAYPGPYDPPIPTSPGAMSDSLASVDAEASWLSGRSNRASARSSFGLGRTPERKRATTFSTSYESIPGVREEAENEDPFSDPIESQHMLRQSVEAPQMKDLRASLFAANDSDSEEDFPEPTPGAELSQVTHGSVARTPTLIRHGARMKSTEGLLKRLDTSGSSKTALFQMTQQTPPSRKRSDGQGNNSADDSSPITPQETPWVESAHARHLSTGSARLLDIPARGNSLRNSAASSPGFPPFPFSTATPPGHSPLPSPGMAEQMNL